MSNLEADGLQQQKTHRGYNSHRLTKNWVWWVSIFAATFR